jgi:hypothetical protein
MYTILLGIHEGVLAKIRREFGCDWLALNPCVVHSFSLVGSQACYKPNINRMWFFCVNNLSFILNIRYSKKKAVLYDSILNFETMISKIYGHFSRSSSRQFKLKQWQDYLNLPERKFKRLFEIRWSSVQGCIKPTIINVQPGQ